MNIRDLSAIEQAAPSYSQAFSSVDGFPLALVQYVPSGGDGGAAATCQVTSATKLTFQVDAANPAGNDAIGDASGDVAFATYTTWGALNDYINGLPAWRMILLGARRADSTANSALTASAASCLTARGLAIYGDASAANCKHGSFAITGEHFQNYGINGHVKDDYHKVRNMLQYVDITAGLTGNGTLTFYAEYQNGDKTAQTLVQYSMTDDTNKVLGEEVPDKVILTAPPGARIVGRLAAVTSFDDIAKYIAMGKSVFPDGSFVIDQPAWFS